MFAPSASPVVESHIPTGVPGWVYDLSVDASMKVSAVYSAVKLISEGVARLTLTLQRYSVVHVGYRDDFNSQLYKVLRTQPNADMSAFDLWRAVVQSMLMHGNAYILPKRNSVGEVTALELLPADTVRYDSKAKIYHVTDAVKGAVYSVRPANIIHLRNIGIDGGYTGLSTIQQAAQALGIMRMADNNTVATLSNGGRMKGILTGSSGVNLLGDANMRQLTEVSDKVERDIAGGKTVIPVPGDMKFQTIALSPADAKVLESKQFTIRDIARYFRVHPGLLYEESNNTYKAAEVPNVMFLTQTLEPLLTQIENELLIKLVPQELWGRRRIRFDREALYTTDLQTEAQYFEKMLQTGIYTVNELRVKKGQPPVEGGDIPLVSANLKGLDVVLAENKTIGNITNGEE